MSIRKRKIATLFLLLVVLAPLFYAQALQWRQKGIQRRMKEQLEQQLLHDITLSSAEIHWYKPGKEIVVDNRLFDVKNIVHLENGKTKFTGLFDDEETTLVQQMKKQQEENKNRGLTQLSLLVHIWVSLPQQETNTVASTEQVQTVYPVFEMTPVNAFRRIPTPPPQG